MIGYLSQSGPLHPKHGGGNGSGEAPFSLSLLPPLHPLLAFIIHYSIAITTIFYVHDVYFFVAKEATDDANYDYGNSTAIRNRQASISNFLFIYTSILFTTRYLSSYAAGSIRHHSVLYELTWLCNSTLVMGCLSLGFGNSMSNNIIIDKDDKEECWWYGLCWFIQPRPMVATSCCIAVSIDQILWYVDLLGYIAITRGRFPVGVMRYLTWEQTLWIDRFTCTHHLWTIPLILVGTSVHKVELEWGTTFGLSVYIVVIQVLLSRWLTPHCILMIQNDNNDNHNSIGKNGNENCNVDDDDDGNKNGKHNKKNKQEKDPRYYRYLNVNLSHELWRDISFPFLQISRDNPPCWKYLFRLLWRWQLFNGIVFVAILRPLSKLLTKY